MSGPSTCAAGTVAEYEAFADQYWSEQRFIDENLCPTLPPSGRTLEMVEECGQAASGSGGDWWLGYIPYVSKEEDKQHYYENLGKYDWFVFGWSDWDPNQPDPPQPNSALREQYRTMRGESNDALDSRAFDSDVPAANAAFYYLVRAENLCDPGQGPLGFRSRERWRSPLSADHSSLHALPRRNNRRWLTLFEFILTPQT